MILVLKPNCSGPDVDNVVSSLQKMGVEGRIIRNEGRTLVATVGDSRKIDQTAFDGHAAVELIVPTISPLQDPDPTPQQRTRQISLGPSCATIGGTKLGIIAGPCSVEDRGQLLEIAHAVKEAGAVGLRGGAFKPRTNPHSFHGLGERALEALAQAGQETHLAVVTEVMGVDQVDLVSKYADVLQIGTRSMHNFNLLSAVGQTSKTILLKRGWSATLEEFLCAAEYIMHQGNPNVILCERGIRTFETYVRNTLALAIVPAVKKRCPLPIIVDPSHGTGVADLVAPLSKAALACGADGLLIEVHPNPQQALTDSDQAIDISQFQALMSDVQAIATAVDRQL